MPLTPKTLDIVFGTPDTTPPDHAGPVGRIVELVNAVATKYIPAAPGVAQKIQIDQRTAFESLTGVANSVLTGEPVPSPVWSDPSLLTKLGDRLLSVADHVPRVYDGDHWGLFPDTRVIANKLSQRIIHTGTHASAAPDAAHLNGVTCTVWQEFNPAEQAWDSFIGFTADNGAVIAVPRRIYVAAEGSPGLTRVATDGAVFWVVGETAPAEQTLTIWVYSTDGKQRATTTLSRAWDINPGYWDLTAQPATFNGQDWTAIIVQPATYSGVGADVNLDIGYMRYTGSAIVIESITDTVADCIGPVAFIRNATVDAPQRVYIATVGTGPSVGTVHVYEYIDGNQTQEYTIAGVDSLPDSITGYVDDDLTAHVAISLLSEGFDPAKGPVNDPALRVVQFWKCERTLTSVFVKANSGLIAQSRAFPVGDQHFLAAYYQSGAGSATASEFETVSIEEGDLMFGAELQPQAIVGSDYTTGGPVSIVPTGGSLTVTQAIATITHNAGDSAVSATQRWQFNNATFLNSCVFSLLNISGSGIATNNTSYRIVDIINSTTIVTEAVGANGAAMQDDTLAGVTASLTQKIYFKVPAEGNHFLNTGIPQETWTGGNVVITGMAVSANNGTYVSRGVFQDFAFSFYPGALWTVIWANDIAGAQVSEGFTASSVLVINPDPLNLWYTSQGLFDSSAEGQLLRAVGFQTGNVGDFEITSTGSLAGGKGVPFTASQPAQVAQLFSDTLLPFTALSLVLKNAGDAYKFVLTGVTFTAKYLNGYIVVSGSDIPANNGTYVIKSIIDDNTVIALPASGATGQRNRNFGGTEVVKIQIPVTSQLPTQPSWFLLDFESPQVISGQWELGIAYADWRFDGTSDGSFPNDFVMLLSSVVVDAVGASMVLPYRAQSFTAGQVFNGGIQTAQQNTVGLKRFVLSPSPGLAVAAQGQLLLPGPLAGAFSDSGFAESNISLGFEAPFLIEKTTSTDPLTLIPKMTYEYFAVAELTDENGDRTLSKPSPILQVTLVGAENKIKLGGRLIKPTNHATVTIGIYRSAVIDGIPSVDHYKITNDLDPNGVGFSFDIAGGGDQGDDTWFFEDSIPDAVITSSEVLYTDRGLRPRFPAPSFHSGVANFKDRAWLIGYDGAIWVSGEKTEGDSLWWNPLQRIPTPVDDSATGLAVLDDYLIVGCRERMRYLAPSGALPSATGADGLLPPLLELPFPNGCNGAMLTIRAGVAYGSTARGVWVLTRSLTNDWLSQPLQEEIPAVLGLAIDAQQRLFVATGTAQVFVFDLVSLIWSRFDVPAPVSLITEWQGACVTQDASFVNVQSRTAYADVRGGVATGTPMSATLAPISFGSVRGWRRLWAAQLLGKYRGPHMLTVTIKCLEENAGTPTDPDQGPPTSIYTFTPLPTKPYVYEFNPAVEESASFEISLSTSFPLISVPGRAATWELITAEVGLQGGIARLPATLRIPKTG